MRVASSCILLLAQIEAEVRVERSELLLLEGDAGRRGARCEWTCRFACRLPRLRT
jgi:hypothetical protein